MSSSRNTVVLAVLRESKFPFFLSQSALNDSGSNPSMRCVLPTWIAASFCLVPLERHSLLNFAPCAGGLFMIFSISLRRLCNESISVVMSWCPASFGFPRSCWAWFMCHFVCWMNFGAEGVLVNQSACCHQGPCCNFGYQRLPAS